MSAAREYVIEVAGWRGDVVCDTNLFMQPTETPTLSARADRIRASIRFVARSEAMELFFDRAARFAAQRDNLWIEVEHGYDELGLARGIHEASDRRAEPFVRLAFGGVAPEVALTEMLGFERGSFTGAISRRLGRIEQAADGTLCVTDLGYARRANRSTLLSVLAVRELARLGNEETIPVRCRALLLETPHATRRIRREHGDGVWRQAATLNLRVPPLRERPSDIDALLDQFIAERRDEPDGAGMDKKISSGARKALHAHLWPGNEIELRNVIRTACALAKGATLQREDIEQSFVERPMPALGGILQRSLSPGFSIEAVLDEVARGYVARAMNEAGGNKTRAAALLGLASYQTLTNWMTRLRMPT